MTNRNEEWWRYRPRQNPLVTAFRKQQAQAEQRKQEQGQAAQQPGIVDENTKAILARGIKTREEAELVAQYRIEAMSPAERARLQGKGPAPRTVSPLEAARNIGAGTLRGAGEIAEAVVKPVERFAGKPLAALVAGLKPESFIPVPSAPPGTTVGDIKVQQEAQKWREERGREPGIFDMAEIIQKAQPLPTGVAGAIELLPWLLIPGGIQSRAGLFAMEAKALTKAEAVTGAARIAYQAAADLLRAGAEGALPLAKVEEGIAKLFGLTVAALRAGLKAIPSVVRAGGEVVETATQRAGPVIRRFAAEEVGSIR
ncbi:MAG: hypothetical protein U0990_00935, partial [Candidatus Nanopelagicales bacterium]|nr:hypothetical protein [Candidatus Nanopelagicales bacterium]